MVDSEDKYEVDSGGIKSGCQVETLGRKTMEREKFVGCDQGVEYGKDVVTRCVGAEAG